jgi:SHS2 domain-containing protein
VPTITGPVIEVSAPTRTDCLAELVRRFVQTFADVAKVRATGETGIDLADTRDADLVARLLGDVCFLLDARGLLVVDVELDEEAVDGHIYGTFFTAPMTTAMVRRSPRVTRLQISVERDDDVWCARVSAG